MEAVLLIVGFIAGVIVTVLSYSRHTIGNLRIDHSIPEEPPYTFMELSRDKNIDYISRQKFVVLNVKVENFITHK